MASNSRIEHVRSRSRIGSSLILLASFAVCLAAVGVRAEAAPVRQQTTRVVPLGEPDSSRFGGVASSGLFESFAPVVDPLMAAVVNISSSSVVRSPEDPDFRRSDPYFLPFFGSRFPFAFAFPRRLLEHSLGSGVIVDPQGYILTNYHILEGVGDIRVVLQDKREFKGRLIGADRLTDLALVKIDAPNLAAFRFGDSSRVKAGDLAFALGSPVGADGTVSMGVISSGGRGGAGIEGLEDFIQTDAAVNAGNTGGALVDVKGRLIGINMAVQFRDASLDRGTCFAVPSDMARGVMEQILKNGRVTRGWLGVRLQPLTLELAETFGMSTHDGALISDVSPSGPAAGGGLQAGDIITAFDGTPVRSGRDLAMKVDAASPGSRALLRFYRDGRMRETQVTVGEYAPGAKGSNLAQARVSPAPYRGLKVEDLHKEDKVDLDLASGAKGVVVGDVVQGSAAALAGIEPGDLIQEVNGKAVAEAGALRSALDTSTGKPVQLLIDRAGSHFFVALQDR